MKIKKLLCLLLTVLICFSLAGCNFIDMMREEQIHANKAGDLLYDDHKYKLLPECDVFMPVLTGGGDDLYLTEDDVPVLLTPFLGKAFSLSDDKKFIVKDDSLYNGEYIAKIYARSDVYEEFANRIESGDYFDGYCYVYSYYDQDNMEYKTKNKFLSTKMSFAIDTVLASEPISDVDPSLLSQFYVMSIYSSSRDFLFQEYAFTIYKTEKFIYLAGGGKDDIYKVSEEFYDAFVDLIQEYYNQ